MDPSDSADLGPRTWTEIDAGATVVVVTVGSTEQHGPHLPLHTDTVIAEALAREVADDDPRCVVAPTITITASGEHQGFPGTLSIGTEVMASVAVELARSAEWAAGIVFVNGHGGNATAMQRATEVFEQESRNVLVWWPKLEDADPHAGHTETSLMLALAPHLVRLDRACEGPIPTFAELVDHGVKPLSPNGVLGDPTNASAEFGRELFTSLRQQLIHEYRQASSAWSWPT